MSIAGLVFVFNGCAFTARDTTITLPAIVSRGIISDLGDISLTISGPGMNTIELTYTASSETIEIKVPSGRDREFTLHVYRSGENKF